MTTYAEEIISPVSGPPGGLLYAIGDVHGRLDLLQALIAKIRNDIAVTTLEPGRSPLVLFLGDYVDRGPASRDVIDEIITLQKDPSLKVVAIRGNHDQYVLDFLENPAIGPAWLDYGGGVTLASYGVIPPGNRTNTTAWEDASKLLAQLMPLDHLEFLKSTILVATFGNYVFVHAGVRPNVPLQSQDPVDLMSIRRQFLKAKDPLPGKVVVFGHTPFDRPSVRSGKLPLDTGAYATGILTAARLLEDRINFIQTR